MCPVCLRVKAVAWRSLALALTQSVLSVSAAGEVQPEVSLPTGPFPSSDGGQEGRDLSVAPRGSLRDDTACLSMVRAASLSPSLCPQDGSVLNICPPPPDEASRDQPDDREDLPWGAQFELPPMLLETDRYWRSPLCCPGMAVPLAGGVWPQGSRPWSLLGKSV